MYMYTECIRSNGGTHTTKGIVKDVCSTMGIRDIGEANYMTTHGLRAKMISMLISAGYSDAAVCLRTGHRDATSLQSYHNLRGRNSEEQLGAVFEGQVRSYRMENVASGMTRKLDS